MEASSPLPPEATATKTPERTSAAAAAFRAAEYEPPSDMLATAPAEHPLRVRASAATKFSPCITPEVEPLPVLDRT